MTRTSDFNALEYQSPNPRIDGMRFTATLWYNAETGQIGGVQKQNPSSGEPVRMEKAVVFFDEDGAMPKLADSSREIPFALKMAFRTLREFRDSDWKVHKIREYL